jgi:glycosyltransferase involved in cell wall biosynthesis
MPPRNEHFTFAVVGHNEAATLRYSMAQALAAAAPGEEVWFVDSGSTDDSLDVAASRELVEAISQPRPAPTTAGS